MLGFEDVHQAKLAFYRRSKVLPLLWVHTIANMVSFFMTSASKSLASP